MEIIKVKIADLAVMQGDGLLITVGLGSCVGIALYDGQVKVAGLAHILLSDSNAFSKNLGFNPGKYADTAIPILISAMEKRGSHISRMVAKIAGGSMLFNFNTSSPPVGVKNTEAVRNILLKYNLPVISEDVGGNYGRTMKLFVDTGEVLISTIGRGEKKI